MNFRNSSSSYEGTENKNSFKVNPLIGKSKGVYFKYLWGMRRCEVYVSKAPLVGSVDVWCCWEIASYQDEK